MTNEKLFKLLKFKKLKSDTIQVPYETLTLGPKVRSWQFSASYVIFPAARGLAGQGLSKF